VCCDTDSRALYFSYSFQLGFPTPTVSSAVANQHCWCAKHRVVAFSQLDHQSYSATRCHHITCLVFGVILGKHPCLCSKFSHTLYTVYCISLYSVLNNTRLPVYFNLMAGPVCLTGTVQSITLQTGTTAPILFLFPRTSISINTCL